MARSCKISGRPPRVEAMLDQTRTDDGFCRDCLRPAKIRRCALRRLRQSAPRPPPRTAPPGDRASRLRRLLCGDRKARRSFARGQAGHRRRRQARRGRHLPAISPASAACARQCRCSGRCRPVPDAIVVPPNMEKYAAVGREVRAMMLDLTPLVEPLSIDEAFLDLSGTERLHGASPAESLAKLAPAHRGRDPHHRFDRALLQQIPGEDRFRPDEAAWLLGDRQSRSAVFPARASR